MGLLAAVKHRSWVVLFILVSLLAVGFLYTRGQSKPLLRTLQIDTQTLEVEVADEPDEITLGLSYRSQIGSDGLLFVLPTRTIPAFWMKGMRFPLDFVWIDGTTVVELRSNVPIQTGASDAELILYRPSVAVTHVLELNAGMIEQLQISVGDRVQLK